MKTVPKLDELACFALYSASRAMTGAYQEYLNELGITYPQYLVMITLWEKDGERVSRIGERLFLDSATLTPVLKRLEAHGLVERRRSTEDERVVEVFLSSTGKRLQRKAADLSEAIFCKTQLSLPELTRLRDTLQELTKNLHAAEVKDAG
jgi:MarR family transcriptional regulator, organic hydroperoxide resistance regulator